MAESNSVALLDDILNLIVPMLIRISPDGKRLVYSTRLKWNHRAGEHTVANIWIAETAVSKSARRLTDGDYNDRNPRWAPDGRSIAFMSDRGGRGKAAAIYLMDLDTNVLKPVTPSDTRGLSKYAFSPDGKQIAFLALEPKGSEDPENTTDIKVWGQDWDYARLWVLDLKDGTTHIAFAGDGHVVDFAWTDDGTEAVVVTHRNPHQESKFLYGNTISVVRLEDGTTREICHFPSAYLFSPVWHGSTLYFLGSNAPKQETTGWAVYSVREGQPCRKVAHGEVDCPMDLIKAGADIAVHVQHGLEDQLRFLLGNKTMFSQRKKINAFDVFCSDVGHDVRFALAQGDVNHATEVCFVTPATGESLQLSNHGAVLAGREFGQCLFLECPTLDGRERLDSLYIVPAQNTRPDGKPRTALPTFVLLHGGPYARITDSFDVFDPFYIIIQPLLTEGVAVLVPNYRGSSGRGERFASYAGGGMGLYDEPDVVAVVQHAIEQGYADKSRLVVGGWSQGGYLSYLSAVRNGIHGLGWRFRAVIAGAGVSDWDSMTLVSDIGYSQGQHAGGVPWNMEKSSISTRTGSALWEFKGAAKEKRIPPMLILHGEKDSRVPISQAWGFRRALDAAGIPFEFVTYPREDHTFRERNHLEDLTRRTLQFIKKHLA